MTQFYYTSGSTPPLSFRGQLCNCLKVKKKKKILPCLASNLPEHVWATDRYRHDDSETPPGESSITLRPILWNTTQSIKSNLSSWISSPPNTTWIWHSKGCWFWSLMEQLPGPTLPSKRQERLWCLLEGLLRKEILSGLKAKNCCISPEQLRIIFFLASVTI